MKRSEITPFLNEFVKIEYNGKYYPSTMHGFIRGISGGIITMQRDGGLLNLSIATVKSIIKRKVK